MNLKFELANDIKDKTKLTKDERLYYVVPYDINENANWNNKSYLIVTTKRILVYDGEKISASYNISDCKKAYTKSQVGCGMLVVNHKGVEKHVVSYSAKHLSRYAYISRGINILISGRFEEVESHEYEKTCPICGRAIPGTKTCPKCSKQGGFLKAFLRMAKPYKMDFLKIFMLMVLVAITTLLNPEIQKHLINDVLKGNGGMKKALVYLGVMFSLSVSIVIINILKSNGSTKLGAKIAADLRLKLFKKYQELPISFINERRPGELLDRITQDTKFIREFMEDVFCNLFAILFIFIWDVIFMLVLNVKLALLTFIFVPIVVVMIIGFRDTAYRIFHLQRRKSDDVSSDLQDVISGMRVVKTYGKEEIEAERFKHLSSEFANTQRKNEQFWAIFQPVISFLMGMGVVVVVYFGGNDVFAGKMSPGELYQFIAYTLLLFQYINWMSWMPRQLTMLTSSLERINDILTQDVYVEDESKVKDVAIKGEVTFDHATFGYKSYQPVLEDINVTIKPGEMIGIVGASGTGKSTLINLLMGLYEVDDGRILIDGIDMKDIKKKSYHSQIGVVLQETFLFSGTIIDNIRFSKPDATYDEIVKAAKMANAHEFICKTPDGYNTYVGEKGYSLSGGERQRIAIARAILTNPRLLILDEATASLDTESEFMIQKALERLTNGKTTFAIAHRLSTLKAANRIMVIDGHRIAEIGTHEELLMNKGIYYNLYKAQVS
ncbi:ABC transporter ATP-binding protein [Eubacterium sp.]|uniref:ABC transporter ATP-binding protein n=1 Tax=Eubacterium sp. TaxID=142586 RepID=UPI0025E718FE|nr:ABC transporter ATP-binding protein [Eubacterium sp.]MCR5629272.1 ABC transporter ATP-binding protein/permease [Eubacterium sp.]